MDHTPHPLHSALVREPDTAAPTGGFDGDAFCDPIGADMTAADAGRVGPPGSERASFEAWFSDGGQWPRAVVRSGDGYKLAAAQAAWEAWKAAWVCATTHCHPFQAAGQPTPAVRALPGGGYEFKTAKQAGLVAGDGQPCPNDHDPDCRWPGCNCRRTG